MFCVNSKKLCIDTHNFFKKEGREILVVEKIKNA